MPFVAPHEVMAPDGATLEEIAARLGPAPWRQPLAASPALRTVLWGWPAGFVTVPHRHPRAEELFHVLSGSAVFVLEGEPERILAPGGVIVAARGVEHTIRVLEGDPFVMLIVVAPNEDAPDETIERTEAEPGMTR